MPTASNAVKPTPPIEWAVLPFSFASRYAGRNGLQSCSPRPKNRTETRTIPTVRLRASIETFPGAPESAASVALDAIGINGYEAASILVSIVAKQEACHEDAQRAGRVRCFAVRRLFGVDADVGRQS